MVERTKVDIRRAGAAASSSQASQQQPQQQMTQREGEVNPYEMGMHPYYNSMWRNWVRPFEGFRGMEMMNMPKSDIWETDKQLCVSMEVPGYKKEDITIEFDDSDRTLCICGENKDEHAEEKQNVHRIERRYGKFERKFKVPSYADANSIKADLNHGVLNLTIPKTQEAPKRRKINVV